MQPLENKRSKIQTGIARARLLLKRDLAWLPGYPLAMAKVDGQAENAISWQSHLPTLANDPPAWSIDGEHLRRAQMTLNKLRHRFPRALPEIVDDVEDWLLRIDFLFGLLKGFIHHGKTFSSDDLLQSGCLPARWAQEANRLKSSHPTIAGLLDAVTFLAFSDRKTCDLMSLAWIEKHAAEIELLISVDSEHPLKLPIRVLAVRESLSSYLLTVLARSFTDPLIRACRWKQPDARLLELRDETLKAAKQIAFVFPEDSSEETLAHLVRTVFDDVCLERPKMQRDRFKLLERIMASGSLAGIAETQLKIETGEEELCKLLRRFEARQRAQLQMEDNFHELKVKVEAAEVIDGVPIATIQAFGNCLDMQKNFGAMEIGVWIDVLSVLPQEHAGLFLRLLSRWWHSWSYMADRKKYLIRVMTVLLPLMKRRGIAASILKNWYHYVDEKLAHREFVLDTSDELADNAKLESRTVRLLERVAYDRQLDIGPELMSSMVEFAQATDDENLSCLLIEHLTTKPDTTYVANDVRLAYHFGDSIELISDLLIALQSNSELTELATQLKPLANDRDLKWIIAKRLADKDVSILSRIAATTAILDNLEQPLPICERFEHRADWMCRYPSEFHSVLQSLGQATDEAPKIAESVLGKTFPSSEYLLQQIHALESKLLHGVPMPTEEVRLQGRLANLRRRATQDVQLSPERQANLIEKLTKRTELEILQQYAKTSRLHAAAAMQQRFNLKAFPQEWLQPPLDRVLREINGFNSPMKELGIRLVFETLERSTRNFDQEPQNVAFRERLEAAGVRMEPWLSDQINQSATTADGCPYELAFTRDVIDFLLMGFHFDTCLSPGSINFFSTVANAVDLNKRVVYAKTESGRVIGRCLFALTDIGEILTYHRYSHDAKDGFSAAVDQFAEQLAQQMQTSIATSGKVSKLVAKDWYDDGPWQSQSDWLSEDGTLAKLMKKTSYEGLLSALLEVKERNILKGRVSELATDDRLRDKNEFLLPLLDEFEDEMTVKQKFTIAVNVDSAVATHRLLSQLRWSEIVGLVNRHKCDICDVFHGIAEYSRVFDALGAFNPTLALRAIRASRPSSIKDDLNDLNRTRRNALAQVHRMLGRERLADELSQPKHPAVE